MPPRIICADESPICCRGIEGLLKPSGIAVAATASSALELREKVEQVTCDAIVCEMRMSDTDMLDIWMDIRRTRPNLQILIYTFHENPSYVARASSLGAFDFLLKSYPPERLIESVHALELKATPERSVLHRAKAFLRSHHEVRSAALEPLTKRELQILVHLALGLSNRDISASLEISLETVKEHVQNVLRKIKANDRTAAAVWAIRNGIPMLNMHEVTREPQTESLSTQTPIVEPTATDTTTVSTTQHIATVPNNVDSNVDSNADNDPNSEPLGTSETKHDHTIGVTRIDSIEPRHTTHQFGAADRLDIREESSS